MTDPPTEGAPAGFAVEVPGFAGPFRLLADLILDQKVDVCDVPIASVTDALYARSIELRAFRAVAVELARRLEDEAGYFARDVGPGSEFSSLYPDPMATLTTDDLASLAAQLLRPPPTLDL